MIQNLINMSDLALTKTIANIITNNLITQGSKINKSVSELVSTQNIIDLAKLFNESKINNQGLAKAIEALSENPGQDLTKVLEDNKLLQITDTGALIPVVQKVIAENPTQVEQYKSGKTAIIGFLVGQCMKNSGGAGNPKLFNELLSENLK
jgi:aspartyl-tRNA(Asn)/glutamyl-tRNA(Gln) amidotransferase subunit B